MAKLFIDAGNFVLTAFISPFEEDRIQAKKIVGDQYFIEIFIDTPLEICEGRDVKGLYAKARSGKIPNFTGIDSPFETPSNPDIHIKTENKTVLESSEELFIKVKNLIAK